MDFARLISGRRALAILGCVALLYFAAGGSAPGSDSRSATSRLAHCSSGECFTARFFLATSRVSRSSLRVITSPKSPSLFLRAELHRCSGDRHFFWRLLSTLSAHPIAGTEEK